MNGTETANKIMQEANHIIEDFTISQYGVYLFAFLIQIALCFGVAILI